MGRKIKYRVWDNENKSYDDPYSYAYYAMTQKGGLDFYCHGDIMDEADPDVYLVELYTGLKDKNGEEIYEGDIVRWSFKVDRNSELTYTADAVKWESYAEEEWPYSTISGFTLPESEDGYEVIGNIHENSDLLGDTNVTNKEEE